MTRGFVSAVIEPLLEIVAATGRKYIESMESMESTFHIGVSLDQRDVGSNWSGKSLRSLLVVEIVRSIEVT